MPVLQSPSTTHSAHTPMSLHFPPGHVVPEGAFIVLGVPALQASMVHGSPSSIGVSVSTFAVMDCPMPLQTSALQSPSVPPLTTVPMGAKVETHMPMLKSHDHDSHALSAGQSASFAHGMVPPLLELLLLLLLLPPMPPVPSPPLPPELSSSRVGLVMPAI
jgi:hypothetical protein